MLEGLFLLNEVDGELEVQKAEEVLMLEAELAVAEYEKELLLFKSNVEGYENFSFILDFLNENEIDDTFKSIFTDTLKNVGIDIDASQEGMIGTITESVKNAAVKIWDMLITLWNKFINMIKSLYAKSKEKSKQVKEWIIQIFQKEKESDKKEPSKESMENLQVVKLMDQKTSDVLDAGVYDLEYVNTLMSLLSQLKTISNNVNQAVEKYENYDGEKSIENVIKFITKIVNIPESTIKKVATHDGLDTKTTVRAYIKAADKINSSNFSWKQDAEIISKNLLKVSTETKAAVQTAKIASTKDLIEVDAKTRKVVDKIKYLELIVRAISRLTAEAAVRLARVETNMNWAVKSILNKVNAA